MDAFEQMMIDTENRIMSKIELVILSVHNDGRKQEAELAAAELAALVARLKTLETWNDVRDLNAPKREECKSYYGVVDHPDGGMCVEAVYWADNEWNLQRTGESVTVYYWKEIGRYPGDEE